MWSEIKLNYLTIDDHDNKVTRLINEWMKTYTENKMKMWGSFMKPKKAKPMIKMSTSKPTREKDSTPTEPNNNLLIQSKPLPSSHQNLRYIQLHPKKKLKPK